MPVDCTQERQVYETADAVAKEAVNSYNGKKVEVAAVEEELNQLELAYAAKQEQYNAENQQLNILGEQRDAALATASQAYIDWAKCEAEIEEVPEGAQLSVQQKASLRINK